MVSSYLHEEAKSNLTPKKRKRELTYIHEIEVKIAQLLWYFSSEVLQTSGVDRYYLNEKELTSRVWPQLTFISIFLATDNCETQKVESGRMISWIKNCSEQVGGMSFTRSNHAISVAIMAWNGEHCDWNPLKKKKKKKKKKWLSLIPHIQLVHQIHPFMITFSRGYLKVQVFKNRLQTIKKFYLSWNCSNTRDNDLACTAGWGFRNV